MPHNSPFRVPGIFVTATDTGVGKTAVTAALAAVMRGRGYNVGVMKPTQTGYVNGIGSRELIGDAAYLVSQSRVTDPVELVCPVEFREPLAPAVAARLAGWPVPVNAVLVAYHELTMRHDLVFVEGAGGIAVPLSNGYLMSDLARDLKIPIVVVARAGLGTINHTVLTVAFARAAGLDVLGVIINNWPAKPGLAETTNPAEIERYAQVPILGYVAHDPAVDTEAGYPGDTLEAMATNPLVDRLIETLAAHFSLAPFPLS